MPKSLRNLRAQQSSKTTARNSCAQIIADQHFERSERNSMHRIFILSPARTSGKRASLLMSEKAEFDLAARLRSGAGVPLGEVFTFLSGLYFRGKYAYSKHFGCPPAGLRAHYVITSDAGLMPAEETITLTRLKAFGDVPIDSLEPRYTQPLERSVAAMPFGERNSERRSRHPRPLANKSSRSFPRWRDSRQTALESAAPDAETSPVGPVRNRWNAVSRSQDLLLLAVDRLRPSARPDGVDIKYVGSGDAFAEEYVGHGLAHELRMSQVARRSPQRSPN